MVSLLRYYLEAEDNLGLMSMVDRWKAVVQEGASERERAPGVLE